MEEMNEQEMRDLDKWLAENVMGWKIPSKGKYWLNPIDTDYNYMQHGSKFGVVWQPTQDIKQAFQCVEKFCTESSFTLHFDPQASYNYDEIHRWISCTPEDENCATATTPALAICLAIKKAEEKK